MPHLTATVAGHKALVTALYTYLAAQGWTIKRYTTDDEYELIAMGPGMEGTDEIYIGVQTYTDTANNHYSWRLRGFTGYQAELSFDAQPGALALTGPYCPSLLLTSDSITYWFVVNTRRIIIVAKCGTSYETAYLGLLLPHVPTTSLPYPLFVGGSATRPDLEYTAQTYDHFSFFNPQAATAGTGMSWFFSGQLWQEVNNRINGNIGSVLNIWPYGGITYNEEVGTHPARGFGQLRENVDGTYTLFPMYVHSGFRAATKAVFGELQGVYAMPKWGQVVEDTVISGDTYLVVQSAYRTTQRAYVAIRLDQEVGGV